MAGDVISAEDFLAGAEAPADTSPYRKAPWYSIYQELKNSDVPLADTPTDPKKADQYLATVARQQHLAQQNKGNRFTEAVDRIGGFGISDETRAALGGDNSGNVIRNLPANIADVGARALQGLQVGIEGTAKTVDDVIDSTGLNDVVRKYLGNDFHPGEGALALMEAFPAGGLEAGLVPHTTFRTPSAVDNISPELRAQLNKEAGALFENGATKEQMNAWAKDRGLAPYGDDFDEAIQARDAAKAKDPNAPVKLDETLQAVGDTRALAQEAEAFKATPEPKPTDVFPTEASQAADAEVWGQKLGAPVAKSEEAVPNPVTGDLVVNEEVAGALSKSDADALFKSELVPPEKQTTSQWEKSLKAEANAFKAQQTAESALPAVPTAKTAIVPDNIQAPVRTAEGLPDPVAPTGEVITRLTDALNNAAKVNAKVQRRLYSVARSERLKGVIEARRAGPGGEAGLRAELSQLKGELPKAEFEGVRSQFSQEEVDGLFNHLTNHPSLSIYDQINARGGLAKLLDGQVPTKSEIKLLDRTFPPEFVKAAVKNRSNTSKVLDFAGNALNLPRSLMSTFDLSAPLRQGVFLVGRKEFWNGFAGMFKQFGSEKAYQGVMDSIRNHPNYPWMEEAKLGLTDIGTSLSHREEAYMSQWAEKIPVIGKGVKASERAYSGFLNKLRADTFNSILEQSKAAGVNFIDDPKALKDIASFVNNATGRGSLGPLSQAGPVLNGLFFSPRLMASRVTMLNPAYYATLSPVVRKEAVKSLIAFGGIASTVAGLAASSGLDVEVDPRSSDFAKIRNGKTRYDILGGFGQYLTLGARLSTNETKNMKGEIQTMGKRYGSATRLDAVIRFATNKESPVASYITDYLRGKNAIGEPFEARQAAVQRMLPLFWQDLAEVTQDEGLKGAIKISPGIFGVGVQTFDAPVDRKTFMSGAAAPSAEPVKEEAPSSTDIPDTLNAEAFLQGQEVTK